MTDALDRLRLLCLMDSAAGVAPPATSETAQEHPDAHLLALGSRLAATWRMEITPWAALSHPAAARRTAHAGVAAAARDIAEAIADISARTMEGLRVKAFAVAWTQGDNEITAQHLNDQQTLDTRIVASLVCDILLMPGGCHVE